MEERTEELAQIYDAEWEEFAPFMGPPTRWSTSDRREDANLVLSIDFSPLKDKTSASLEVNGSDFSFSGETSLEGFRPADALEKLIDRFDRHLVGHFGEKIRRGE